MSSISTVGIEILAQVISLILRPTVYEMSHFRIHVDLNYHRFKFKFRAYTWSRMPLTRLLLHVSWDDIKYDNFEWIEKKLCHFSAVEEVILMMLLRNFTLFSIFLRFVELSLLNVKL